MEIENIIVVCRGQENCLYKLNGYSLPLGVGGAEKNVVQNIDILLKRKYKISFIMLGINKLTNSTFALKNINLIPMPLDMGKIADGINFLKSLLFTPPFKIKGLEKEKTMVIVHDQFISALLIKLFQPKFKVILVLEGTYKGLAWTFYINNLVGRVAYFLISFFSIFMVDKIMTDRHTSWLLNTKIRLLREKTYFMPNSIDTNLFSPVQEKSFIEGIPNHSKMLLYVGRLGFTPQKNPELLLQAFEYVQKTDENIKLLIIGISTKILGNLLEQFWRKNGREKIKNINCIELVQNEDLPKYYGSADLTLLTSKFEGTPYVVLESLACGTPCVVTDVLDPGIIDDGANGYICKNFNPKDFAELILKGLKLSSKIKFQNQSLLNPIYLAEKREDNLLKVLYS